MKRPILASALCLLATSAAATPVFHASGANLSYGQVSNIQTITAYVGNPAAPAMAMGTDNGGFGFGILSSVGADIEIGDIGFYNRIITIFRKFTLQKELDDSLIILLSAPRLLGYVNRNVICAIMWWYQHF